MKKPQGPAKNPNVHPVLKGNLPQANILTRMSVNAAFRKNR